MNRYQARDTDGTWSILDRLTRETLPSAEAGPSRASAVALAMLLNTLDDQQQWRAQAAQHPTAVA
ncbi:MAG: hypothetical protein Q8M88_11440 [Phenylobacterium sp.]|uniref:hypothetical protein n=1 Tax=Phenylobacterium sp. TaxID=1871053 RepID=UPI002734954B|nr:hypothetical protein [Phenylobacterium sp.]MDP3175034.1 hypothetical protein [Phenylobacterium sp.]